LKKSKNSKKKVKVKKRKIWKVLGIIFGILILLYFVIKIIFINIYIKPNIENINIKINNMGNINNKLIDEYYTFDNFKFRNDFKDYEVINENKYEEETESKSIALKSDNNQAVIIEIRKNLFSIESFDLNSLDKLYLKFSGWNLNNEKKVILRGIEEINDGFNIFDSFHKMIFSNIITTVIIGDSNLSIFKQNNLDGYIIENKLEDDANVNYTNIIILKDNYAYSITFFNKDNKLSDEYIKDFVSTIVIE